MDVGVPALGRTAATAIGAVQGVAAKIARAAEPWRRRTGSRVLRGSVSVAEGVRYRRALTWGEAKRILEAADGWNQRARKPGRAWGPLSPTALRLLRVLAQAAVKNSGAVELSVCWLATMLRCCAKTVTYAKAALQAHGFVGWVRRYVPTGLDGQRGPQVEQTANAYWVMLPPAAASLLSPAAPPPEDAEVRAATARAENDAQHLEHELDATPLGGALKRAQGRLETGIERRAVAPAAPASPARPPSETQAEMARRLRDQALRLAGESGGDAASAPSSTWSPESGPDSVAIIDLRTSASQPTT